MINVERACEKYRTSYRHSNNLYNMSYFYGLKYVLMRHKNPLLTSKFMVESIVTSQILCHNGQLGVCNKNYSLQQPQMPYNMLL